MIKIYPYIGVNDLKFLMSSEEVNQKIGPPVSIQEISKDEFYEIRNGNKSYYKNNRLLSISYQNNCVIEIGNNSYSLPQDGEKILTKENPPLIHGNYTFTNYGIAIYGLDYPENGIETTIYSSDLKSEFEGIPTQYPTYKDLHNMTHLTIAFHIDPYKGVGPLKFGMNPSQIENELGKAGKIIRMNNGEVRELRGEIQTRYNKYGKLVQVNLNDEKELFLNGEDISKNGWKSNILKNEEPFINRAYKVYLNHGISMSGYDKANETKAIVIFSEEMRELWKNIHRPLL